MEPELENMTRTQLMAKAKEMGVKVSVADNKPVLIAKVQQGAIERIKSQNVEAASSDADVEPEVLLDVEDTLALNSAIVENAALVSQDEIKTLMAASGVDSGAPLVFKEPLTSDGFTASEVADECTALFAGRAIAKYDRENNPHCIEFHGGPRKRHDVTVAQPRKAIVMYAKVFCSRAETAGRDIGSIGDHAAHPLAQLDVDAMTPAEQQNLADNLRKLGIGG